MLLRRYRVVLIISVQPGSYLHSTLHFNSKPNTPSCLQSLTNIRLTHTPGEYFHLDTNGELDFAFTQPTIKHDLFKVKLQTEDLMISH